MLSFLENNKNLSDPDRDYWFFVVNKKDHGNVVTNSLKSLPKPTGNPSNPPFQVNWKNNAKVKKRTFNQALSLYMDICITNIEKRHKTDKLSEAKALLEKFKKQKKNLGQVFTETSEIKLMMSMMQNSGSILEPASGTGNFLKHLPQNTVSIELDASICNPQSLNMDFFNYDVTNKFDTIIGNPPYVAFKEIIESTKMLLNLEEYDKRTNLHVFFTDKCLDHLNDGGEIIFVTPREFIKQTSVIPLIKKMSSLGSFTHFYDYGDKMLFEGFSPNCAIWRFEKGNFNNTTKLLDGSVVKQQEISGQLVFSNTVYDKNLSDIFSVKVGAVSGLDSIFVSPKGNKDFVYSETRTTGKTRKMYHDIKNSFLESHKKTLISRKIRTFSEDNWWEWGRGFHSSDNDRIYINSKTRQDNPFFTHTCKNYDGSVLALFPKVDIDIANAVEQLNKIDWNDLGFKAGGRYVFAQKNLQNIKIPSKIYDRILDK